FAVRSCPAVRAAGDGTAHQVAFVLRPSTPLPTDVKTPSCPGKKWGRLFGPPPGARLGVELRRRDCRYRATVVLAADINVKVYGTNVCADLARVIGVPCLGCQDAPEHAPHRHSVDDFFA